MRLTCNDQRRRPSPTPKYRGSGLKRLITISRHKEYVKFSPQVSTKVIYYIFHSTVEPLSNDHPHQQPSLLYDHILCDGQCFLFVQSLTDDPPSDATNDRVRWDFLPRERPPRLQYIYMNRGWRFNIRSQWWIITMLCLDTIALNFLLFWRHNNNVLRSTLHHYNVASPTVLRHICGLIQVLWTSGIPGAVIINGNATWCFM